MNIIVNNTEQKKTAKIVFVELKHLETNYEGGRSNHLTRTLKTNADPAKAKFLPIFLLNRILEPKILQDSS